MKIRLAKKIMKHKPSDVEWKADGGPLYKYSHYWLYRFEMYEACDFHGHYWEYDDWVNEQRGFLDHRITKAISLTIKENEKSRRSNRGSSKEGKPRLHGLQNDARIR